MDQDLHVGPSWDGESICAWERTDQGIIPDWGRLLGVKKQRPEEEERQGLKEWAEERPRDVQVQPGSFL